jgi:hypothetical protein
MSDDQRPTAEAAPPLPQEAIEAANHLRQRVRRARRWLAIEPKTIVRRCGGGTVTNTTMRRFLATSGRHRIVVPTPPFAAAVTDALDQLERSRLRGLLAALDPAFAAWDAARQAGDR